MVFIFIGLGHFSLFHKGCATCNPGEVCITHDLAWYANSLQYFVRCHWAIPFVPFFSLHPLVVFVNAVKGHMYSRLPFFLPCWFPVCTGCPVCWYFFSMSCLLLHQINHIFSHSFCSILSSLMYFYLYCFFTSSNRHFILVIKNHTFYKSIFYIWEKASSHFSHV